MVDCLVVCCITLSLVSNRLQTVCRMSVMIACGLTMRPAAIAGLSERMNGQYILDNVCLLLNASSTRRSCAVIDFTRCALGSKLNNNSCE
jgi:hypothetical protein